MSHCTSHVPMELMGEPPYAVSQVLVGWSGGLTAVVGSTLASAPVSNLQVMSPLGVVNLDSLATCCASPSICRGSTSRFSPSRESVSSTVNTFFGHSLEISYFPCKMMKFMTSCTLLTKSRACFWLVLSPTLPKAAVSLSCAPLIASHWKVELLLIDISLACPFDDSVRCTCETVRSDLPHKEAFL